MNREDFLMLNKDIIYFDNGATTFKPSKVIEAMDEYYNCYCGNAHRGDYKISHIVDKKYEGVRNKVKKFIKAKSEKEIVFTSGTTESLNLVVGGYFKKYLKKDDEIILTKSEHASNLLPWFVLTKELDIKIKYIPLNEKHEVTIDNLKSVITENTKVISFAHITNVIGDIRPIKDIITLAHSHNILTVVDGAQSMAHTTMNVSDLDVDFLTFSAHKMYGPTGVGVLYGKEELLNLMNPLNYGGGMNQDFISDTSYTLKEIPTIFEAGTPNIAGVIGLGEAIDYITNIGINRICEYEHKLKKYLLTELQRLDFIEIYNPNDTNFTVAFNIKNIFSQDTAIYLDKYNICVRAGNHCAKILKEEININNTCRISLAMYNTKEEVDLLINVLKNYKNLYQEIL